MSKFAKRMLYDRTYSDRIMNRVVAVLGAGVVSMCFYMAFLMER